MTWISVDFQFKHMSCVCCSYLTPCPANLLPGFDGAPDELVAAKVKSAQASSQVSTPCINDDKNISSHRNGLHAHALDMLMAGVHFQIAPSAERGGNASHPMCVWSLAHCSCFLCLTATRFALCFHVRYHVTQHMFAFIVI